MMKKQLIHFVGLILLMALCQPIIAQSSPTTISSSGGLGSVNRIGQAQVSLDDLYSRVRLNQSYASRTESLYARTDGTPYLYDEFRLATIIQNDNREIRDVEVNYDGYAGEMIAINKDGDKIILDPGYYKDVLIDTKDGPALFSKPNPEDIDKFYQILYETEGLVFFKEEKVSVREGADNGRTYTPDRFVKRTKYYVVNGDNKAVAVSLKKRELLDYFTEIERAEINKILKRKKIKLKKEKDYLALFELLAARK